MDGGEKKGEASLPTDYVSLAQLQERWLRKKQEELELKQKQEEEEKREREARARNERNQNQRVPAKMAGGFVRETGAVQDKGKGKEIVSRGPGNGGDSDNTGRKNGRRGERKFKGDAVVEKNEKVGIGAEVLSGGGGRRGVEITAGGVGRAGIVSRSGDGLSVVEVLPRNGVIADAKRADLRGGLRGNGRNHSELALALEKEDEKGGGKKWLERGRGRNRVNGLKQTEPAVNLGKEDEGENGLGMKWLERNRERGRNGVDELKQTEPKINLKEGGEKGASVVNEWKQIEPATHLKKGREKGLGKKWLETRRKRGRNGVNELESEPEINLKEGEGVEKGSGGVIELKQSVPAMNSEESEKGQDNKWKYRGRERDRNGVNELKQTEPTTDLEKEKGENGSRKKWKGRGRERGRGRNGVDQLNQSEVALDLEKEEEGEKGHGKNWRGRGSGRGRNGVNELKQSEVALDSEGEMGGGKKLRGIPGGFLESINRFKDMPVVIEGNEKDSELKNKAEDEISEVCSEITSLSVGDTNGIPRQDKAIDDDDDDGVEEEGSNGLKVAVEIEKKVDHEILARKGESWDYEREYPRNGNREGGFGREYPRNGIRSGGFGREYPRNGIRREGFGREYPGNGNWRGGFTRGRRYSRSQISDRMNSKEIVQVWVKKEDKLDA